jgi:hypothetical protein
MTGNPLGRYPWLDANVGRAVTRKAEQTKALGSSRNVVWFTVDRRWKVGQSRCRVLGIADVQAYGWSELTPSRAS